MSLVRKCCCGGRNCWGVWLIRYNCLTHTLGVPTFEVTGCQKGYPGVINTNTWTLVEYNAGDCLFAYVVTTDVICNEDGDCTSETVTTPDYPGDPDADTLAGCGCCRIGDCCIDPAHPPVVYWHATADCGLVFACDQDGFLYWRSCACWGPNPLLCAVSLSWDSGTSQLRWDINIGLSFGGVISTTVYGGDCYGITFDYTDSEGYVWHVVITLSYPAPPTCP